ncbi:MAG: HEAT repeat domain-containing protein [Woeseiaceae bacterium]
MDWLFRSGFDATATVALWSMAGVLATTVVLFAYTMGLRLATIAASRNRKRFVARWREVFAGSALSAGDAWRRPLPRVRARDRIDLLEEWNRIRASVEGSAADNLIVLANRAGIPAIATRLFAKRRIRSRILATQTLGHLHDREHRDAIRELVDHENTALSITAAVALVGVDPDYAVQQLVPLIETRRDWPKTRVSVFLRMAGSERVSEPMYRAIRSADSGGRTYLLQFAQLMESSVLDAMVQDLVHGSNDPRVLNAALKLVSGIRDVPRIAALTRHETWYVRMQAAKALGRLGQQEHLPLLEDLLRDREWWVRYRSAQALAVLPFLGPNRLRQIQRRQTDPYAADILQQVCAEAGLA